MNNSSFEFLYNILDILLITTLVNFIYVAIFGEFNQYISRLAFTIIVLVYIFRNFKKRFSKHIINEIRCNFNKLIQDLLSRKRIFLLIIIVYLYIGYLFVFLYQFRDPLPSTVWNALGPYASLILLISVGIMGFICSVLSIINNKDSLLSKIIIILFIPISILIRSLYILTFEAGYGSDQWIWLGYARTLELGIHSRIFPEGYEYPRSLIGIGTDNLTLFQRLFLITDRKLQPVLVLTISSLIGIDIYYVNLLLIPLLCGLYFPIIFYEIIYSFSTKKNLIFLSYVLTGLPILLRWQSSSVPMSLSIFLVALILRELLLEGFSRRFFIYYLAIFLTHGMGFVIVSSWLILILSMMFKRGWLRLFFMLFAFLTPLLILSVTQAYKLHIEAKPIELNIDYFTKNIVSILMIPSKAKMSSFLSSLIIYVCLLLSLVNIAIKKDFKKYPKLIFLLHYFSMAYIFIYFQYIFLNHFKYLLISPRRLIPFLHLIIVLLMPTTLEYYSRIITFSKRKIFIKVTLIHKNFIFRIIYRNALKYISCIFLVFLLIINIFYGYPHEADFVSLKHNITLAELKAVRKLHQESERPYLVLCYFDFGRIGVSIVGIRNPMEYYDFPNWSPKRWSNRLYREAIYNPDKFLGEIDMLYIINNASVIYIVVSKWRQGEEIVNRLLRSTILELYLKIDHVYIFRIAHASINNTKSHRGIHIDNLCNTWMQVFMRSR